MQSNVGAVQMLNDGVVSAPWLSQRDAGASFSVRRTAVGFAAHLLLVQESVFFRQAAMLMHCYLLARL